MLVAAEVADRTPVALVAFMAAEAVASTVAPLAEADTTEVATTAAMAVAATVAGLVPTAAAVPTEEACVAGRPRPALHTMHGHRRAMEFVIHPPGGIPSNNPPTGARWPENLVPKGLDGSGHKPARAARQIPIPLLPMDNGTASVLSMRVQLWL